MSCVGGGVGLGWHSRILLGQPNSLFAQGVIDEALKVIHAAANAGDGAFVIGMGGGEIVGKTDEHITVKFLLTGLGLPFQLGDNRLYILKRPSREDETKS